MKLKSLMMLSLSVLTAANSAFAASSEYKCVNRGYRDDAFEVSKFNVTLQQTSPEGLQPLVELAKKNLGLENRFDVRSISLVLDRSELCSTPMPYIVDCNADQATGYIVLNGYIRTKENISASVHVDLRTTLKNLKLKSILSARGPVAIGSGSTIVDLNQLGVQAETLVEINGTEVQTKWRARFETQDDERGFTYCKPL